MVELRGEMLKHGRHICFSPRTETGKLKGRLTKLKSFTAKAKPKKHPPFFVEGRIVCSVFCLPELFSLSFLASK